MRNFAKYRVIEFLELLSSSVLPIIFWMSIIFGFDAPYVAVLTILSAVIHEFGHCAAISLLTGRTTKVRGHATGLRIKQPESISYGKEVLILLAGPTINIAVFILTLPLDTLLFGYLKILGYVNLFTGLSNLIPIEGYDGYRALMTVFDSGGRLRAIKALEIFSFIVSISVTFISLHVIDLFGEGYWIFGLFFIAFMSKLINFGKYSIFEE